MMSKLCWQGTSIELVKVNQLYQVHELCCTVVERVVDLILILNLQQFNNIAEQNASTKMAT